MLVCGRVVRVEADGVAKILNGLRPIIFRLERKSAIMVSAGEVRLRPECLIIICDGVVPSPAQGKNITKVAVGFGIIWFGLQYVVKLLRCLFGFSFQQKS